MRRVVIVLSMMLLKVKLFSCIENLVMLIMSEIVVVYWFIGWEKFMWLLI